MTATAASVREPRALDPFAEQAPAGHHLLNSLNPLSKIAAPLPVMVLLIFTRGIVIPSVLLALTIVLLLCCARLGARARLAIGVGVPAAVAVLGISFGIWVDPARLAGEPLGEVVLLQIGDWRFTLGAYLVGVATALRVAALMGLALIGGLTSTGPELVRALVQNLRVPYRIGWTAFAAFRFVPRFGHELDVIRAAHRVRGTDAGSGPIAATRRTLGYAVPLLASAIRHAERVSLAMDARAFGAYPTRTERVISRWRVRDTVFVVLFWLIAAAVYLFAIHAGLGGFVEDRADLTIR